MPFPFPGGVRNPYTLAYPGKSTKSGNRMESAGFRARGAARDSGNSRISRDSGNASESWDSAKSATFRGFRVFPRMRRIPESTAVAIKPRTPGSSAVSGIARVAGIRRNRRSSRNPRNRGQRRHGGVFRNSRSYGNSRNCRSFARAPVARAPVAPSNGPKQLGGERC